MYGTVHTRTERNVYYTVANKSDYRRLLCVNESSAIHLSTHAADRRFKQDSGIEQAVVDVNDV